MSAKKPLAGSTGSQRVTYTLLGLQYAYSTSPANSIAIDEVVYK